MRNETVEIYSDAINQAVLRHPSRKFPGVLIQGDTLFTLWVSANGACTAASPERLGEEGYEELVELRDRLRSIVDHYKAVLAEHGISLPFVE
jgi:hypothetical protein